MAGEASIVKGSYAVIIPSESKANAAFSSVSLPVATALSAAEAAYIALDFKLELTTTAPTENGTVNLYRIAGDGTDSAPTPAGSYKQKYVGSFTLDNAVDDYFFYNVPNIDSNDTFILENEDGTATLTWTLHVRARTLVAAI